MRELAEKLIKETAVLCGLDEELVMRKPERSSMLDPEKRIELEFLPENYTYSPRRIAKWTTADKTNRKLRKRLYTARFTVRAEVISDDEEWLSRFVRNFIRNMPTRCADDENNLVKIRVEKAVRKGFKEKMVEVFIARSNSLHITFEWMLCRDDEVPFIHDVDVQSGLIIGLRQKTKIGGMDGTGQ